MEYAAEQRGCEDKNRIGCDGRRPVSYTHLFDGFLTELLKSSYKDTGVAVGKDDKVLTLSTCSGDGLRFVVHAVRVDEHESGM